MKRFLGSLLVLLAIANPASAQTQVVCNQGSAKVPCTAPLLNTYPNWASPGTIGSGTATTVRGTTITATTQFSGSGAGLTALPAASIAGSLSGVVISCASNTCSNIANAALLSGIDALKIGAGSVNNTAFGYIANLTSDAQTQLNGLQPLDADLTAIAALAGTGGLARVTTDTWALRSIAAGTGITVTNNDFVAGDPTIALTSNSLTIAAGTGLSVLGCGPVALGGTCTPSIANTGVAGNSYPTPGQIPTFTVNAQGQLTAAGSTTTLTSPAIATPVFSGSATGTYTLAGTPTITAPALSGTVTGTYTFGGMPTLGASLAAGSNKITGLATATTSGDALAWPWITATNGSASLSSSPYNVASGSYASIGLALSLPSAGTYYLAADLRTLINASLGTGGYIECQLYNTTDAAAIADSERIGAYENVIALQFYGQISINEIVTIAAAKTIDVQCLRTGATTYTTSAVYSDANGRSRFSYVKVSP